MNCETFIVYIKSTIVFYSNSTIVFYLNSTIEVQLINENEEISKLV